MTISPAQAWAAIAAVLAAIVLVINAFDKILSVIKIAKQPNDRQNERIDKLEQRTSELEKRLELGNTHFAEIDEANRVTQMALLALLDHSIDGNNIDQLNKAKEELRNHLVRK